MTDKKQPIDWAGIEKDFCTTTRSIREIAGWYQISEGAIRKKAKAKGWKRAADPAGTQTDPGAYPAETPAPSRADPPKIDEVIGRGRNIADRLLDELDATTLHRGEMEVIIEMNEADPTRVQALKQAVSLPVRAKTLQTIAAALKTMGETAAETPKGKKAQRQASAEAATAPGSKFAPRQAPRLAVDNT